MAHNDFTTVRPIPWIRHGFIPIPAHMRGTLDTNEMVEFGILCNNCKSLSGAIGRVQNGSASQPISGISEENTRILETAKSGCQLCVRVLNLIGRMDGYYDAIPSAFHWKWSFSASDKHGEIKMTIKLCQKHTNLNTEDLPDAKDILVRLPLKSMTAVERSSTQLNVPVTTMSDEHVSLSKTWMRRCSTEHLGCTPYEPSWLPTRLMEIVSPSCVKLIETTTLCNLVPYYALSYCWGKEKVLTTTNENVDDFRSRIPFFDMALTIQDTVTVVHRLGGRYLWVDSICIIQDNDEDWNNEAATMCDVYQNAFLTIVALGAAGATEGLYGRRDPLAVDDCRLTADLVSPAPESYAPSFGTFYRSVLQKRGWTFQERALAPRKLFFSSYLYWECTSQFEEETTNQGWQDNDMFNRKLVPLPIQKTDNVFSPDHLGQHTVPQYLANWYDALQNFTARDLTKPTDRLVAISGVIKFLERSLNRKSCYGMWLDFFPSDLLWKLPGWRNTPDRLEGLPTWSWASLTAAVKPAYDTKRRFLPVRYIRMKEFVFEEMLLVLEGKLLCMTYKDASCPLPRPSERERRLKALIGAGQERKVRALMDDRDAPTTEGRWSLDGMRNIIDCVATLDFGPYDSKSPGKCFMVPMILQASKHFSKDSPLIHCHGLGIQSSPSRPGCYQRLGVFDMILDMESRRRDRLWTWKGKIEEPIWPQDARQVIRLV